LQVKRVATDKRKTKCLADKHGEVESRWMGGNGWGRALSSRTPEEKASARRKPLNALNYSRGNPEEEGKVWARGIEKKVVDVLKRGADTVRRGRGSEEWATTPRKR